MANNPPDGYLDTPPDGYEDVPSQTAVNISAAARPVLEMGGAIGGGILGSAAGPIGTAGGGALGFATGKSAADLLSRSLGVQQPLQNIPQAATETLQNISQGGQVEAFGLGLNAATKAIANKYALPAMQNALGYSKRFLGTKEGREAAKQGAQVALDNNVMPLTGNPAIAAQNLEQVQQQSGQALGDVRQSVGPKPVNEVFNSLQTLRDKMTQGGAVGGAWDSVHDAINDAQNTIIGLQQKGTKFGEVDVNKIEAAKKIITDGINYVKKNASQETAKKIGSAVEDGVEKILEGSGVDMQQYAKLKRTYGGSSNALQALNNQLSKEGNDAIGLPAMIMGAGELGGEEGGHGILNALGITGGVQLLKGRGMGISAAALNTLSKTNPALFNALSLGLSQKVRQ